MKNITSNYCNFVNFERISAHRMIFNVMKKLALLLLSMLLFTGCSFGKKLEITITNSSSIDRVNDIVSIPWQSVTKRLELTDPKTFIITNEAGEQIPFQVIYNGQLAPQSVIFPVSVMKGKSIVCHIEKGQPQTFKRLTLGRPVPERKDDFAWENDRIAFRMYGPSLASENPSNGVDVWLKKTDDLIVDRFYKDDLENGLSYHIDHGLGLDCYKVAHSLGAGGIAPFFNDTLWIGGPYSKARVLDSGALRTSFELMYDSVPLGNKKMTQKITIVLDAFSQLNKAEVSYNGDFDTFELAGGFWLHDEVGNIKSNLQAGYIAYAENASDSKIPAGRTYIAVIFPDGMKTITRNDQHLIGLTRYKKRDTFTYYFGAGWSDWGFKTDDSWFDYVDQYTSRLKQPLQIVIK